MDIHSAIVAIENKKKKSQRIAKYFFIFVSLLLAIYFSLPFSLSLASDVALKANLPEQSSKLLIYSELFRDQKEFKQKMEDVIYLDNSGLNQQKYYNKFTLIPKEYQEYILHKNMLTETWCNEYIKHSLKWMAIKTIYHTQLRTGRIMCFDVIKDKAGALDEARVYADELSSGTYFLQTGDPNNEPIGFSRLQAYLGLTLMTTENGLYGLSDKLVEQGSHYRYNGQTYASRFKSTFYQKPHSKKEIHNHQEDIKMLAANSPTLGYFRFLYGELKREDIKHFQVDE